MEASQKLIEQYNSDVNTIVGQLETPLADNERGMLNTLLGVNNPLNDLDISDRAAVRQTARTLATQFSEFINSVKQQTVDEYASGKSRFTVSKPGATPPVGDQNQNRSDTPPVNKNQSKGTVDEVFGSAERELAEILLKAIP
jgi:hypothetical protein